MTHWYPLIYSIANGKNYSNSLNFTKFYVLF